MDRTERVTDPQLDDTRWLLPSGARLKTHAMCMLAKPRLMQAQHAADFRFFEATLLVVTSGRLTLGRGERIWELADSHTLMVVAKNFITNIQKIPDENARVAKFYGTPLTAFLSALCEPGKMYGWTIILRRTLEGFVSNALPASASGQAHRAAARFGLAAAAGELTTALGITGWPDGTATTAVRVCLNAWLNERGGAGNYEGDAIIARLRQVIERFGESRFTRWESAAAKIDEHGPRTIDRLGFRKSLEHGLGDELHTTNTYYILPAAWRSEVFKGMNINAVNKELLRRCVLEPGKDGKASCTVRLPRLGTQRCYVVKTIPGAEENDAQAA